MGQRVLPKAPSENGVRRGDIFDVSRHVGKPSVEDVECEICDF